MKKILFAVVGILLLTGAGCGNYVAEKAVEKMSGDKVDVSNDGESVKIKTEEGTLQMGGKQELPEGWSSDAPYYPGATIQFSGSTNSAEGKPTTTVVSETKDSSQKVLDFYKKEFEDKGWTIESNYQSAEMSILVVKKDNRVLSLTIIVNKESTSITSVLENK